MENEKVHIKTESGFECEVDADANNDQELLEALIELDNNPLYYIKTIKLLLGEQEKQRLYDHLRNENGRVPATKVMETIGEIIKLLGEKNKELKNSLPSPT